MSSFEQMNDYVIRWVNPQPVEIKSIDDYKADSQMLDDLIAMLFDEKKNELCGIYDWDTKEPVFLEATTNGFNTIGLGSTPREAIANAIKAWKETKK